MSHFFVNALGNEHVIQLSQIACMCRKLIFEFLFRAKLRCFFLLNIKYLMLIKWLTYRYICTPTQYPTECPKQCPTHYPTQYPTQCPTHCVQHSVSNTVSKHEEKIKTLQNYNFTNTLANTHNVPSQESHDISVV